MTTNNESELVRKLSSASKSMILIPTEFSGGERADVKVVKMGDGLAFYLAYRHLTMVVEKLVVPSSRRLSLTDRGLKSSEDILSGGSTATYVPGDERYGAYIEIFNSCRVISIE